MRNLHSLTLLLAFLAALATPTMLTAADALDVAELAAAVQAKEKYLEAMPTAKKLGVDKIVAFEDNARFVYVLGTSPGLTRRVLLLKPSVLVVNDQIGEDLKTLPALKLGGNQHSQTAVAVNASVKNTDGQIVAARKDAKKGARLIHVIRMGDGQTTTKASTVNGIVDLTVSNGDRRFDLTLPPGTAAGKIEIRVGDKEEQRRRPLPAGVLPHGAEGVRLLERWDSAYRRDRKPGWDTGRPSAHLTKAVDDGTIKPCRAVVLGCGTGTNAIYLASKGFDVSAIDIAPTALAIAEEKAKKAGVKVNWLVADVLNPPELAPFDFLFDRGCYHGVRRHDAKGYVTTADKLSTQGNRVLILAGNANEARHYGPPRVEQLDIAKDFSGKFDIVRLVQSKFNPDTPGDGPWCWSILLRKKTPKKK